jgi:hypothetical protein
MQAALTCREHVGQTYKVITAVAGIWISVALSDVVFPVFLLSLLYFKTALDITAQCLVQPKSNGDLFWKKKPECSLCCVSGKLLCHVLAAELGPES